MNKLLLALFLAPALAFADGDSTPVVKDKIIAEMAPGAAIPAYISILSMASQASIQIASNTGKFNVVATGATQTKDESKIDDMLSKSSVKNKKDGGIEISIKRNGLYRCSVSTSNGYVTEVSGQCITNFLVNFPSELRVPVYFNGQLMVLKYE